VSGEWCGCFNDGNLLVIYPSPAQWPAERYLDRRLVREPLLKVSSLGKAELAEADLSKLGDSVWGAVDSEHRLFRGGGLHSIELIVPWIALFGCLTAGKRRSFGGEGN